MLEVDKIKQLVEMMVANDLVEISLRDGDVEVNLRRPSADGPFPAAPPAPSTQPVVVPAPSGEAAAAPSPASTVQEEESDLAEITSPMVGTFYAAADPDSPPFITVGSEVHPGSVVCILEAMKVFNEIKAEVAGTVERILVKNEQPVEYGQPLFLLRPL